MAQTVLHRAASRGVADHGWLKSHHTFSFGSYFNPERIQFGALRVINDDMVDGGRGFGEHPHDNMEIISIPLEGALEHKDSMGNIATIEPGEIQVMSAGTGIYHTEYNKDQSKPVKFLQIWVFPNKRNVEPRYDQVKITTPAGPAQLEQILSPNPDDAGVWIHQNAWFSLAKLEQDNELSYRLHGEGNGAYVFVLNGDIEINGISIHSRDGFGITEADNIEIKGLSDADFLIMEVPMTV